MIALSRLQSRRVSSAFLTCAGAVAVGVWLGAARADSGNGAATTAPAAHLQIAWKDDWLTVSASDLPGKQIRIHYLEAYCRSGSHDRAWDKTCIAHHTALIDASPDGSKLTLRCTLDDGVIIDHQITAHDNYVQFELTARNPTDHASDAQWAQPCIRVGDFTGASPESYLGKCFVDIDGKLTRLPTLPWATAARYTPGQVWAAPGVDGNDVNPRPLSKLRPSDGLIGCFSADESWVLGTAWEPYQELFQGVAACIHSDFRIGGLAAGQSRTLRGRLYLFKGSAAELHRRYVRDFPAQVTHPSLPATQPAP